MQGVSQSMDALLCTEPGGLTSCRHRQASSAVDREIIVRLPPFSVPIPTLY